jgi:hypothetical protein
MTASAIFIEPEEGVDHLGGTGQTQRLCVFEVIYATFVKHGANTILPHRK